MFTGWHTNYSGTVHINIKHYLFIYNEYILTIEIRYIIQRYSQQEGLPALHHIGFTSRVGLVTSNWGKGDRLKQRSTW